MSRKKKACNKAGKLLEARPEPALRLQCYRGQERRGERILAQGLSEARRECEPAIRLKGHQKPGWKAENLQKAESSGKKREPTISLKGQ